MTENKEAFTGWKEGSIEVTRKHKLFYCSGFAILYMNNIRNVQNLTAVLSLINLGVPICRPGPSFPLQDAHVFRASNAGSPIQVCWDALKPLSHGDWRLYLCSRCIPKDMNVTACMECTEFLCIKCRQRWLYTYATDRYACVNEALVTPYTPTNVLLSSVCLYKELMSGVHEKV